MRRLLVLAAIVALAIARPETYREKEDFQYSRSSSDEGHKSGYYGAQRGNMGGNYERAHNMDGLAQHQMSGLVRQVEGELGDATKQRTGSVYTAAKTRGVYGSGHYDLSNLEGRNFEEGVTFDDSQSHSALSSRGSRYNAHSYSSLRDSNDYESADAYNARYRGHSSAASSGKIYANSHQSSSDLQTARQYDNAQTSHNSGYYQAGYQGHAYDQANLDTSANSNVHSRLVSTVPVRIVIRPGSRIAIPVATQQYEATQDSSKFDQNSITADAEVLNSNDQNIAYKPTSNAKHYESSYSYRKEWEKHNTQPINGIPLAIPTPRPYARNSELYEDVDAESQITANRREKSTSNMHTAHASHSSANVKSSLATQSRHDADYNTQFQNSAASNTAANAYTHSSLNGGLATLNNQVEDFGSKPKSYQSSYSYHKSWERQGDPYVIKPVSGVNYNDGQASQKLMTSSNTAYGSHSGSQSRLHSQYHSNAEDCDCDEYGHVRVARSYNEEELGQQVHKKWDNLEDLGQQTQTHWDQIDVGQQTQNKWDNLEQNKRDRLEDLGQQAQTQWDKYDGTQQNENRWEKLEDMGQKSQTQWDQQETGQQTSNNWNKFIVEPQSQNFGQETQPTWFISESTQKEDSTKQNPYLDIEKQIQNQWNKFHVTSQDEQKEDSEQKLNTWFQETDTHDGEFNQQVQSNNDFNTHSTWDKIEKGDALKPNNPATDSQKNESFGQETDDAWSSYHPNVNKNWGTSFQHNENHRDFASHHSSWENTQKHYHVESQAQDQSGLSTNGGQSAVPLFNLWDKLDKIEKETTSHDTNGFDGYLNVEKVEKDVNKRFEGNTAHNSVSSTAPTTTTTTESIISLTSTESITKNPNKIVHPKDIGRGDIGPEDSVTTEEIREVTNNKPYKTPEEIESLALHKVEGNSDKSDKASKHLENTKEERLDVIGINKFKNNKDMTSTTTGYDSSINIDDKRHERRDEYLNHFEDRNMYNDKRIQQNINKHFNDFGQQEQLIQQNLEQQLVNLEQQVNSFKNQTDDNDKHFGSSLTSSMQHVPPILENVEQQNDKFEQQSQSDWHVNDKIGQELQSSWHPDEKFEQESQSSWRPNEKFEQESQSNWHPEEKFEQESQSSWHPYEKFEQESQSNWHPEQKFEQESQSSWHPNEKFEQESQSSWHPNEKFEQELQSSWHPNERFDQESQSSWQPNENFEQESQSILHSKENFEQESQSILHPKENFEQESQSILHPKENFEQESQSILHPKENFEQESKSILHPNEKFEQETQSILHPNERFEQESEWNQNENFEQESQSSWKLSPDQNEQGINYFNQFKRQKPENLEQQNVGIMETDQTIQSAAQDKSDLQNKQVEASILETPSEPKISQLNAPDLQLIKNNSSDLGNPPEPVTEKVGFWKSVGSKFVSAKDKVASWFKS